MKKYLYILVSIAIVCMTACSKNDEVPGVEPPAVDKEWIFFDDVVLIYYANGTVATPMTPPCQVLELKTDDGYVFPATVDFQAQLFKGSRYLLNNFMKSRIVSVAGGGIYLYKDEAPAAEAGVWWVHGNNAMRNAGFSVLPLEPGTFDFYIEVEEIENPTPRPYAFRSRVYRLVLSRIEGGWNIDSFGLAPGQEDANAAQ